MSDTRRSGRKSRKQVDYSQFGDVDSGNNSDDDFAEPTPPPAKKPKTVKEKKKQEPKEGGNTKKRKERTSLDDKLYERDLELALELSKHSSQESNDAEDEIETTSENKNLKTEETIPQRSADDAEKDKNNINSKEEREIPEEKVKSIIESREESPSDEESDFNPKDCVSDVSEVSEFEEDSDNNDSDFEFGTKSQKKKQCKKETKKKSSGSKGKGRGRSLKDNRSPVKPRMSATVTPINRPGKLTPKRVGNKPRSGIGFTPPAPLSSNHSNSSLTTSSSLSIRKPAWCSSGSSSPNPLGGVSLKSPSAPMRLGLSKSAKVKPLHSNVKIK